MKSWRDILPVHPAADLFPLMSESELRELGEDIKKNGLRTPIVCYSDGDDHESLIDGRNRLDALALAGLLKIDDDGKLKIKRWRETRWIKKTGRWTKTRWCDDYVAVCWTNVRGDDPYGYALGFNVHRRHLTPEQKRELIASVLKAKPEASNRQIAKQVKADDKTVASVRRDLESTAEIPQLEKTIGADGKARPTIRINGQTVKSLDGFSEAAKQQIADAVCDDGELSIEEEHQIDFIGDHIECARRGAETVHSMWGRIERRNERYKPDALNDIRDDVAAEIRALIIEWQKALALVAPCANEQAA